MRPSWATVASSPLSGLRVVSKSWRTQTHHTPAGEIRYPAFASSLATRTCPQVGCSTATATTAASTYGATRFRRFGLRRLISRNASSPPCS